MGNGWFTAYVIELEVEAQLGPRPDTSLPYLYVGVTHNTPERRFEIHREGGRTSAEVVYDHGVALRPDLYSHYKKVRYPQAAEHEQRVADELRAKGYVVHSGSFGFPYDSL